MYFEERAPVDRNELCISAAASSARFSDFASKCQGLFPTVAQSTLAKIAPAELSRLLTAEGSIQDLQPNSHGPSSFLFSTWDFTQKTRAKLTKMIENWGSVLCLGCPTLAITIAQASPDAKIVLVDANERRLNTPGKQFIVNRDISQLSGNEFKGAFSECVLDPPWYLLDFLWWIWIARRSLSTNGHLIFPLFGSHTRPSAHQDRQAILRWCQTLGFEIEIFNDLADYTVPSFEGHILKRAGLPVSPWKRADIVKARVKRDIEADLRPPQPPSKPFVFQIEHSDILIEVSFDRYDSSNPDLLLEPIDGFLMKSPSRGELGNKVSNVFTSTGKRAICTRPLEFAHKLFRVSKGQEREDSLPTALQALLDNGG
tara:strand:- start:58 stop:1170 length:1113 start_codon:yes stop_codon:yes gene_type:complete